jgi:hypothetical protein
MTLAPKLRDVIITAPGLVLNELVPTEFPRTVRMLFEYISILMNENNS